MKCNVDRFAALSVTSGLNCQDAISSATSRFVRLRVAKIAMIQSGFTSIFL